MSEIQSDDIKIDVETEFLAEQSEPADDRYVFAYTITITNTGGKGAQLLKRHWIITDANNQVQEVKGDGVVGEQPYLQPGTSYRYTSGTIFETPVGTMEGSYEMQDDDGDLFAATIPTFSFSRPGALH